MQDSDSFYSAGITADDTVGQRWLRLFGQFLSIHKWHLAVCTYAAVGREGRFSQYTRSGVRPSSARCGLS